MKLKDPLNYEGDTAYDRHVKALRTQLHWDLSLKGGFVEFITGNNELILMVDDEEMLVDIGVQMLEDLGYRVEGSTNPVDALKIFELDPDRFDLVVSDMSMPGMNGEVFVEEIRKIRSNIPVMICSGFNDAISDVRAEELLIGLVLKKPIPMEAFARGVRTLLDSSAPV